MLLPVNGVVAVRRVVLLISLHEGLVGSPQLRTSSPPFCLLCPSSCLQQARPLLPRLGAHPENPVDMPRFYPFRRVDQEDTSNHRNKAADLRADLCCSLGDLMEEDEQEAVVRGVGGESQGTSRTISSSGNSWPPSTPQALP